VPLLTAKRIALIDGETAQDDQLLLRGGCDSLQAGSDPQHTSKSGQHRQELLKQSRDLLFPEHTTNYRPQPLSNQ
jgi:hypothetical protein